MSRELLRGGGGEPPHPLMFELSAESLRIMQLSFVFHSINLHLKHG